MKHCEKRKQLYYIICDYLSALTAWCLFFLFRKSGEGYHLNEALPSSIHDPKLWLGAILIPLSWLLLYAIVGSYRHVLRKARLQELVQTFLSTLIGCVIIFFACLIDDDMPSRARYYIDFLFLFGIHFLLTYACRLMLTTHTVKKIHSRQWGFPTLMIGSGNTAYKTYIDLENQEIYSGNAFAGYITLDNARNNQLDAVMPNLGTLNNLHDICIQYNIEEAVIALDNDKQDRVNEVIRALSTCGDIIIKIAPNSRDIIVGNIKINNIFHSPLLTINNRLMPEWQYSVKRIFDVTASLFILIACSPIYLITAIIVKCTSPGPVFFAQERIGYGGRPFKMIKFRSMYVDAEKQGPALSKDNDPRITPFGRFMRKVRLDEFPQFYNVLRGNMSIVGPRPERQYYIDQIVKQAPEYLLLQRIRPGITSWGQVKYGYASSVDEMVERLRYDLFYLDNMSLTTDIKILLYTIIIICQGRGK
ncbi:MAG: sugar transferase [Bacteroidales bacterium]|nr:sugar transferase [Bacteroidales bacterium]